MCTGEQFYLTTLLIINRKVSKNVNWWKCAVYPGCNVWAGLSLRKHAIKIEKVADFADFMVKESEDSRLLAGIYNFIENSDSFAFLTEEEDLYTLDDQRKVLIIVLEKVLKSRISSNQENQGSSTTS